MRRLGRSLIPELLRERFFRRYWACQTISMFGDQISGIVLPRPLTHDLLLSAIKTLGFTVEKVVAEAHAAIADR